MTPMQQMLLGVGAGDTTTDALWLTASQKANSALTSRENIFQLYSSSLTETAWEVPAGVTSISVAVMGGGGGGKNISNPSGISSFACGGGELSWRNGISVTPGQILYVKSGVTYNLGATGPTTGRLGAQGMSADASKYVSSSAGAETTYPNSAVTDYSRAGYIRTWSGGSSKWLIFADGGSGWEDTAGGGEGVARMLANPYGTPGTAGTDYINYNQNHGYGGYGRGHNGYSYNADPKGAGGAGGWTGTGGHGSSSSSSNGDAGTGGGSGGGGFSSSSSDFTRGRGGDTYMWGQGNNGAGGAYNGGGGDGSASGGNTNNPPTDVGKGGGAYRDGWVHVNSKPPSWEGWARIVWSKDGTTRNFPGTNVGWPG